MSIAVSDREEVSLSSTPSMSPWAETIYQQKYAMDLGDRLETWPETAERVTKNVLGALGYSSKDEEYKIIHRLIAEKKFLPGGRYLYASGREFHQVNNCLLLKAEDSREGWSDLLHKASMALMTGAGIGIDYSDIRGKGSPIKKTGGVATGPLALMQMINECGRGIMQGGNRRSAVWAGLKWSHPDIFDFINVKDWPEWLKAQKEKDVNTPAPMDMTNISVLLDDEFFEAYQDSNHPRHNLARDVYHVATASMLRTAEPGFSINLGSDSNETLRNACTELTSEDDSDICNLGSLNLAQFDTLEEFEEAVPYATLFLLAGTVYSQVPYPRVADVREKNRRLGLGIMGVHEWLLKRGYRYEPNAELADWLEAYARSGYYASQYADAHELSRPVKTRAIAPTGTIGIIAETTTGIEPLFCVAYKRQYLVGADNWKFQYVIEPVAERLITEGVDPDAIEDAYVLSYDVERRIAFQAFIQRYVDHAISSTINIPAPITNSDDLKRFEDLLFSYLPLLRGITVYPDGARGGQPLNAVPYHVAKENEGVVFDVNEETCVGGVCGL